MILALFKARSNSKVQPQGAAGAAKNAPPSARPAYARGVGGNPSQVAREEAKENTRMREELEALRSTCQGYPQLRSVRRVQMVKDRSAT